LFSEFKSSHGFSFSVFHQFEAKNDAGYETIWIEDQVPRFVGPGLRSILFA